jgi:hypothetical protein
VVTDRWPVDFRYTSTRLVHQIVQQTEATRGRSKLYPTFKLPFVTLEFRKDRIDEVNEFALCREATEAVRDHTGTIAQSRSPYIRAELDLTMGLMPVLRGWQDATHVEIAAMKAELEDPESGRVLVALFGSASNYRGRKPIDDGLVEIPSDVDGLYGILERTREPGDPVIEDEELDRDIGHTPDGRADTAVRLMAGRFKGFHEERLDVLMKPYCTSEGTKQYDQVIVGTPLWVRTPEPKPLAQPATRAAP